MVLSCTKSEKQIKSTIVCSKSAWQDNPYPWLANSERQNLNKAFDLDHNNLGHLPFCLQIDHGVLVIS